MAPQPTLSIPQNGDDGGYRFPGNGAPPSLRQARPIHTWSRGDYTPPPTSKKLWNVAGFSKAFTDAKGVYHAVDHNGEVKVPAKDVQRLLADGFTATKPVAVKTAEEAEQLAKEARLEAAKVELALAEEELNPPKAEAEKEGA